MMGVCTFDDILIVGSSVIIVFVSVVGSVGVEGVVVIAVIGCGSVSIALDASFAS